MPKPKPRKNVDEHFKLAAVQRLQTGDVPANELAKELGVSVWSLRKWSRIYRKKATAVNERALNDLRLRFVAFEERLIRLRLVPAREVLERAAVRAGRIAARQLGKEVEFRIEGADVGIERSLADVIGDPLLHLVRNAIIHGLEEAGDGEKPAASRPRLERMESFTGETVTTGHALPVGSELCVLLVVGMPTRAVSPILRAVAM